MTHPEKYLQEVRDFAARKELDERAALEAGMREKAAEFVAAGARREH
jgi:phosphomethylpyrimidine synthase